MKIACKHKDQQLFSQKDSNEAIAFCNDCQERTPLFIGVKFQPGVLGKFKCWEDSSYYINNLKK